MQDLFATLNLIKLLVFFTHILHQTMTSTQRQLNKILQINKIAKSDEEQEENLENS